MTADELKGLRESRNYTQAGMAEYLDVNLRTYQDWEQGRFPVPDLVARLLIVLDKMIAIGRHYKEVKEKPTPEMIETHEQLLDEYFKPANIYKPRKKNRKGIDR